MVVAKAISNATNQIHRIVECRLTDQRSPHRLWLVIHDASWRIAVVPDQILPARARFRQKHLSHQVRKLRVCSAFRRRRRACFRIRIRLLREATRSVSAWRMDRFPSGQSVAKFREGQPAREPREAAPFSTPVPSAFRENRIDRESNALHRKAGHVDPRDRKFDLCAL